MLQFSIAHAGTKVWIRLVYIIRPFLTFYIILVLDNMLIILTMLNNNQSTN